jgi:ATP-dependent Lon protease
MPGQKWQVNFRELLDWANELGYDASDFRDLFLLNNDFPMNNSAEGSNMMSDQPTGTMDANNFPTILPILPLRGLVVFPQTAVPLTIGQPRSIRLIDEVSTSDQRLIGLLTSKNPELESPDPADLYQVGTIGMVHRLFRAPDGTIRLLVQGLARFHVDSFLQTEPYIKASIKLLPEITESGIEVEASARNARNQFEHIGDLLPSIPRELVSSISTIQDPLQTAYTISNFQRMEIEEAQQILELDSLLDKLRRIVSILTRENEVLELGQKIQNEAREEIEKGQRDYFLREQLKAIHRELGETDDQTIEVEEFRKKIDETGLSPEAEKIARRELDRLSTLPLQSAEYGVVRTYLDWLVSLPWKVSTSDNLDITHARQVLEADHYGLTDIKKRILEFLSVRQLRSTRKAELDSQPSDDMIRHEREGVILCFIGPPSIARALGRKFIRISLGGTRDEAEIRGHRRTYIGAMPGRILQSLRRVESCNPVFMMDEIDKLGFDFHGDPASALLEVLDPEQNIEFRDNYLEVAFDLSQVMFITTANSIEMIPAPLLDRMEIIFLSGYTEGEKIQIAIRYLIPRQLRENGLHPDEIHFTDDALEMIIRHFTRESGVRSLERQIGSICRKIAVLISENEQFTHNLSGNDVISLLGREKYSDLEEISRRTSIPGVATGLAWTPFGGEVLFIEATQMPGGKGFQVTGSIGAVMQESARAALSYIRSHAAQLNLPSDFFDNIDIHLHVPAGSQPKDGPSAGITMITALVSLLSNRPVKPNIGMTGEITLRGLVLPIGGVKEKILAAHRAGLTTVILPRRNGPDLEDLPEEIKKAIHFKLVDTVDEVLDLVFDSATPKKKLRIKRNQKPTGGENNP